MSAVRGGRGCRAGGGREVIKGFVEVSLLGFRFIIAYRSSLIPPPSLHRQAVGAWDTQHRRNLANISRTVS